MIEVLVSQEPANDNDSFDLSSEDDSFLDDLIVALYETSFGGF